MAWISPATYVVNQVVTAAVLNTHLRDNLAYLKDAPIMDTSVAVGDTTNALTLTRASATAAAITLTGATSALIDIDPKAGDGTSLAALRFFRSTNTSGNVSMQIFKGNNTSIANAQIGGNGVDTYFCANNGKFGIGMSAPTGPLHTNGAISGFLHYEFDGLDGTARTLIPNGAVDVIYNVAFWAIIRSSGGTVVHVLPTNVAPGVNVSAYSIGADIVQFQVNANGAVTIQRTGGTLTYKVVMALIWL